MKKIKISILIGLVLSILVGCGSKQTASTTNEATGTNEKPVVVAIDADLSSLDHNLATDETSFIALTLAMAGLTEIDANMVAKPDLAESWEVSEDGLTYTFHLRDAQWSNGTPITANDFVFGFRRLANPETASEYNYLVDTIHLENAAEVIAGDLPLEELGIKALDDKTLEIKLSIPTSFLLSILAFPPFFPLNEEFYTSTGDQYATSPENMIYSGPYQLTSWTPGNGFAFLKNENYHSADSIDVKNIEFRFIQDTQSAILEYQSGNLDVVKLSGEMVDAYKGDEGFTEILNGYLWFLSINHNDSELSNVNLRQAIAFAIDRDTIAKNILKDGSVEADGATPKNFASNENGVDYRENSDDLTQYDPAKALEFYEAFKVENGSDATIDLLFEDSESSKAVAEYIQNNLETNLPGITVTLNSKPKKTRLQLMIANDYEIALHRWGPDYADPQTFLDLFTTNSSMNQGKYSNKEYDELIEKAVRGEFATNLEQKWNAFREAEKILITQDAGIVPVYQTGGALLINPKISGIEFHTAGVHNYRHIKIAE